MDNYLILFRESASGLLFWLGERGLRPCINMADNSPAYGYSAEETEKQIEWYSKFGFELEHKEQTTRKGNTPGFG